MGDCIFEEYPKGLAVVGTVAAFRGVDAGAGDSDTRHGATFIDFTGLGELNADLPTEFLEPAESEFSITSRFAPTVGLGDFRLAKTRAVSISETEEVDRSPFSDWLAVDFFSQVGKMRWGKQMREAPLTLGGTGAGAIGALWGVVTGAAGDLLPVTEVFFFSQVGKARWGKRSLGVTDGGAPRALGVVIALEAGDLLAVTAAIFVSKVGKARWSEL